MKELKTSIYPELYKKFFDVSSNLLEIYLEASDIVMDKTDDSKAAWLFFEDIGELLKNVNNLQCKYYPSIIKEKLDDYDSPENKRLAKFT